MKASEPLIVTNMLLAKARTGINANAIKKLATNISSFENSTTIFPANGPNTSITI